MILPDVNVLIYAFRRDATHHRLCNAWLTNVVSSGGAFGLSTLTTNALVRITTNARTNVQPSSLDEAFRFCNFLFSQPNCRTIEPGDRHWSIFERVCVETRTTGPRVTDAWFAALAIEHGCEWITLDRDFARFPGLRWREPS